MQNEIIRRMFESDVEMVVKVHIASFPGFFLSFLGPRFLSHFYYGICSANEGIAFVCLDQSGKPAGFVAGTANPRGFYLRLLKRDWLKFACASIIPIMRKPTIVKRIARAILHPSENPPGDDVAGLFSIGVLPELQGTGAGKKLVQAFLDEARRRGCKRVFLNTDRDNNDSVNSFYKMLGFVVERQYVTPEDRKMNEYWINI